MIDRSPSSCCHRHYEGLLPWVSMTHSIRTLPVVDGMVQSITTLWVSAAVDRLVFLAMADRVASSLSSLIDLLILSYGNRASYFFFLSIDNPSEHH